MEPNVHRRSNHQGYFRTHEEKTFPWELSDSSIWYAVLSNRIKYTGFTSSKSGRLDLLDYLKMLKEGNESAMLLGVWTGRHRTDLFVLDTDEAIKHLTAVL